jgi:nitrite reductase/ring-hydroxylating ferredoxin subunit
MNSVEVASVDDVPVGTIRHVEAKGIEIVLANVKGTIYAVSERCGHQNAPLSKGTCMRISLPARSITRNSMSLREK